MTGLGMATFFSDFFSVEPQLIEAYGAFDVSLVTDLPLFIDPFLLFNSKEVRYKQLHEQIVRYLRFLRDKSQGEMQPGLLRSWYHFPEVKQNWLGFTTTGNGGSGLGADFASALHENLHKLFPDFGSEPLTQGSHLEKLCLVREGVGRDNISDFTTNLIKDFLCRYTEGFAKTHLRPDQRRVVAVEKARFNYDTESWEVGRYELPWINADYVILTPKEILTKDDTWINKADLYRDFEDIPTAIPDADLRAQVNNYFEKVLVRPGDKEPTKKEHDNAARKTILEFPELIDYYIRFKEERGDLAQSVSAQKVRFSEEVYIGHIRALQAMLLRETGFYAQSGTTYAEAKQRLAYLKDVVENKGGHRIFYVEGSPIQREEDLQVMYRLVWFGTESDVTREANDGRGPADFKISRGARDKTIVEFKLAKNSQLERNLTRQAEIYQRASDAKHSLKCILYFTYTELEKVQRILERLKLDKHPDIVLIDARIDNKPSGSKA